ncbi:hypothetical protein [Methanosarcina lacustris]|uniref:hypothetical protein n=1 Tax=Methanosarcina lacustris TaxID=170861 RepID=UPI0018DDFCC2|nr:hypothetical protein [Methanosarcina lacustris]
MLIKIPVHFGHPGKTFHGPVPLGIVRQMYSQTHAHGFHNKRLLCGNVLKTIVSFNFLSGKGVIDHTQRSRFLIIEESTQEPGKGITQFSPCAVRGWNPPTNQIKNNLKASTAIEID